MVCVAIYENHLSFDAMSQQFKSRERAIILDDLDPTSVIESLPPAVFPVTAKLELNRSSTDDSHHPEYRTPEYPVDMYVPTEDPYIPTQTVYFDNPAERPPSGGNAWRPDEFIEKLGDVTQFYERETNLPADNLYLSGLCTVEIPSRYLSFDQGQPVASPNLYEENGEMVLAYFQKDSSLSAHQVREDLGDALPGEKRTPMQLTRLDEVYAKSSRIGRDTVGKAGRRRYYSEREATKSANESMTPGIWVVDRVTGSAESHRPLDTVLTELDEFLPVLTDTSLLKSVTFHGSVEETERFYAEAIIGGR
jgi:hypothetical protein